MHQSISMHSENEPHISPEVNKVQVRAMFAAVFSQKAEVSAKRLAILRAINRSSEGKMRFKEILSEVQSMEDCEDYSSQKLTYDLGVLRQSLLLDQTTEGYYLITESGYYLLDVYEGIEYKLGETRTREKPGFVGIASGTITADNFDCSKLGLELSKLPFFKKAPCFEKNTFRLRWADNDDDFKSEIEINHDGSFAVQVIIYRDSAGVKGEFMEDLEKNEKWYEIARGLVLAIVYYIDRTASKIWRNLELSVPLPPDSYPLNIYKSNDTE